MRFYKHMTLFSVPIKQLLKRYFTYFMVLNLIMTNVVQAFGPSLCVEMMRDEIDRGHGFMAPAVRLKIGRKNALAGEHTGMLFSREDNLSTIIPQKVLLNDKIQLEDGTTYDLQVKTLEGGLFECLMTRDGHESLFVFDLEGKLRVQKLDAGTSYKINAAGSTTIEAGEHHAKKVTFGSMPAFCEGNLTAAKVSAKGVLYNKGQLTTHRMHVGAQGAFYNDGALCEGGQGFIFENEGKVSNFNNATVSVGAMTVRGTGKTENAGTWTAQILTSKEGLFVNKGTLTTDSVMVEEAFLNKGTLETHEIHVREKAQLHNAGIVHGRGKGVLLQNQGSFLNKDTGQVDVGRITLGGSGKTTNMGRWRVSDRTQITKAEDQAEVNLFNRGEMHLGTATGHLKALLNTGSLTLTSALAADSFINGSSVTASGTLDVRNFNNCGEMLTENLLLTVKGEGVNQRAMTIKSLEGEGSFKNVGELKTERLATASFHNTKDEHGHHGIVTSDHLRVGAHTKLTTDADTQMKGAAVTVEEGGAFTFDHKGHFIFGHVALLGKILNQGIMKGESLTWKGELFHLLEGASLFFARRTFEGHVVNDARLLWQGGTASFTSLHNRGDFIFNELETLKIGGLTNTNDEGAPFEGGRPKNGFMRLRQTKKVEVGDVLNGGNALLDVSECQNATLSHVTNHAHFQEVKSRVSYDSFLNFGDFLIEEGKASFKTLTNDHRVFFEGVRGLSFEKVVNNREIQGINVHSVHVKDLENNGYFIIKGGSGLSLDKVTQKGSFSASDIGVDSLLGLASKIILGMGGKENLYGIRVGHLIQQNGSTTLKDSPSLKVTHADHEGGQLTFSNLAKVQVDHMGQSNGTFLVQELQEAKMTQVHHHGGTAIYRDNKSLTFGTLENKDSLFFTHNQSVNAQRLDNHKDIEASFDNRQAQDPSHGLFKADHLHNFAGATFSLSGGIFESATCVHGDKKSSFLFEDLRRASFAFLSGHEAQAIVKQTHNLFIQALHNTLSTQYFEANEGLTINFVRNGPDVSEGSDGATKKALQAKSLVAFKNNKTVHLGRTPDALPQDGIVNHGTLQIDDGGGYHLGHTHGTGNLFVKGTKASSCHHISNKGFLNLSRNDHFSLGYLHCVGQSHFEENTSLSLQEANFHGKYLIKGGNDARFLWLKVGTSAFFNVFNVVGLNLGKAVFCGESLIKDTTGLSANTLSVGGQGDLVFESVSGTVQSFDNHTQTMFIDSPVVVDDMHNAKEARIDLVTDSGIYPTFSRSNGEGEVVLSRLTSGLLLPISFERLTTLLAVTAANGTITLNWPVLYADQDNMMNNLPRGALLLVQGYDIELSKSYNVFSDITFQAANKFHNLKNLVSNSEIVVTAKRAENNGLVKGAKVLFHGHDEVKNTHLLQADTHLDVSSSAITLLGHVWAGQDLTITNVMHTVVHNGDHHIKVGGSLHLFMPHHTFIVNALLKMAGSCEVSAVSIKNNAMLESQGHMKLSTQLDVTHAPRPDVVTKSSAGAVEIDALTIRLTHGSVHGAKGVTLKAHKTPCMDHPGVSEAYKDRVGLIELGEKVLVHTYETVKPGNVFHESKGHHHYIGCGGKKCSKGHVIYEEPGKIDQNPLKTFVPVDQVMRDHGLDPGHESVLFSSATPPQDHYVTNGMTLSSGGALLIEADAVKMDMMTLVTVGSAFFSVKNEVDALSSVISFGEDLYVSGDECDFKIRMMTPERILTREALHGRSFPSRELFFDENLGCATKSHGWMTCQNLRQDVPRSRKSVVTVNGDIHLRLKNLFIYASEMTGRNGYFDCQSNDITNNAELFLFYRQHHEGTWYHQKKPVQTLASKLSFAGTLNRSANKMNLAGFIAGQKIDFNAEKSIGYTASPYKPNPAALKNDQQVNKCADLVKVMPGLFEVKPEHQYLVEKIQNDQTGMDPFAVVDHTETILSKPTPFNTQMNYFDKYLIEAPRFRDPADMHSQTLAVPDGVAREVIQKMIAKAGYEKCYRLFDRLGLEMAVQRLLMATYNTGHVIAGLSFSEQVTAMLKAANENPDAQMVGFKMKMVYKSQIEHVDKPSIYFELLMSDGMLVTVPLLKLPDDFIKSGAIQHLQSGMGAVAHDTLGYNAEDIDLEAKQYAKKVDITAQDTLRIAMATQQEGHGNVSRTDKIAGSGEVSGDQVNLTAGNRMTLAGATVKGRKTAITFGNLLDLQAVNTATSTHTAKKTSFGGKKEKTVTDVSANVCLIEGTENLKIQFLDKGLGHMKTAGGVLKSDHADIHIKSLAGGAAHNTHGEHFKKTGGKVPGSKGGERHLERKTAIPLEILPSSETKDPENPTTLRMVVDDGAKLEAVRLGHAKTTGHIGELSVDVCTDTEHLQQVKHADYVGINKVTQSGHYHEHHRGVNFLGDVDITVGKVVKAKVPKNMDENDPLIVFLKSKGATIEVCEDIIKKWHKSQKSLSPLAMVAVGVGCFFLIPTPSAILGVTTKAAMVAAKAAICCGISQFSNSIVSHDGDPVKALKQLVSFPALQQMAIAAATAGLCEWLCGAVTDPTVVKTFDFIEKLKEFGTQAAVNAGVQIALAGEQPLGAMKQALVGGIVSLGASFLSFEAGVLKDKGMHSLTHKLMHGAIGGLTAAALGKDIGAGAIGQAVGAAVAEKWLAYKREMNPGDLTEEASQRFREEALALAKLAAGFGAYVVGRAPEDAACMVDTALSYDIFVKDQAMVQEYERKEAAKVEAKAKKSAEVQAFLEQRRLENEEKERVRAARDAEIAAQKQKARGAHEKLAEQERARQEKRREKKAKPFQARPVEEPNLEDLVRQHYGVNPHPVPVPEDPRAQVQNQLHEHGLDEDFGMEPGYHYAGHSPVIEEHKKRIAEVDVLSLIKQGGNNAIDWVADKVVSVARQKGMGHRPRSHSANARMAGRVEAVHKGADKALAHVAPDPAGPEEKANRLRLISQARHDEARRFKEHPWQCVDMMHPYAAQALGELAAPVVVPVIEVAADALNVAGDWAVHGFGAGVRVGFELDGYNKDVAKGVGGVAEKGVEVGLLFAGVGQVRQAGKALRAIKKAERAAGGLELGAAGKHVAQHGHHAGEIVEHAGKAFPQGAKKVKKGTPYDRLVKKAGRIFGSDMVEAHHLISPKNKIVANHDLWKLSGVDKNALQNLMLLPTPNGAIVLGNKKPIHKGRHGDAVHLAIREQMDKAVELGAAHSWNQAQYAEAMRRIMGAERKALLDGKRALGKKNARPGEKIDLQLKVDFEGI
ncbi:MAG: AHH domain-containing protein [Alphaproteobacteria bacterium]